MNSGHDAHEAGFGATGLAPTVAEFAVRAIGLAVIATDADGVVELWNPGAEKLYGWSAAEATGQPITTLLALPSDEPAAVGILAPLGDGQPWSGDFPVVHKSGRAFAATICTWPVGDGSGRVVGFVGLSHESARDRLDPVRLAELGDDFDPDATAVEIVTRGLDPDLRAAVDADPHGTVLPAEGVSFAELDELLASLVALAVHTATVAAERCGGTAEDVVAAAALRLRWPG
jgi:PAS domain S-box-containing protein